MKTKEERPKILFTDLDDTLLTTDKKVGKRTLSCIEEMLFKGHKLVLATGRPISGGRMVLKDMGLSGKGCYILSFQGSMAYDCEKQKVLMKQTMQKNVAMELLLALKKAGIYAQTYNEKEILVPRQGEELAYYNKITREKIHVFSSLEELSEEEMPKVLAIDLNDHEKLVKFQKGYQKKAAGKLNSFFSNPHFLEYTDAAVSKGTGLFYLAKTLQIPMENTVAVGDEQNDVSMIQAAAVGCAVKNAVDEAKNAADYVTKQDNNHDAVGEVIEKFILQ